MLTALALLAASGPASPREPRRSDQERLDAYLQRLGLFDLQVRNLEREMERHGDNEETLAQHLAEVYANRRLTLTDPASLADLDRPLQHLLIQHPKARTPALEVVLLEGDYNRAEAKALRWVDEPDRIADRDASLAILDRVVPAIDGLRDTLLRQVNEGTKELEKLPDGHRRTTLENQLQRAAEVAGRATYFSGWANYYRNLMKPVGPTGTDGFKTARLCFRKLLGTEEGAEPQAEDLDVETQAQARLALGMGLAELACGHADTSHAFFEALRSRPAHASVRGWADYWEVWALLRAGQSTRAREVAEKAITAFTPDYTPEKGVLCKLLMQAAESARAGDAAARSLGALGVRGLVQMQRLELARQLMQKYPVDDDGSSGVAMLWMRAQRRLERAEARKARLDYQAAAQAFQAVLDAPEAASQPLLAAETRFALGCCQYRSGDYAEALDSLQRAESDLTALKAATAADAVWMVALTRLKVATLEGKDLAPAIAAFRAFQQHYPDHPNTRLVDSLVAQLDKDSATADKPATETSGTGAGTNPSAAADPIDAARRDYRRWQALDREARAKSPLRTSIRQQVDDYLKRPDSERTPERTLEALVMSVEVALSAAPPDVKRARADLGLAEPLAAPLGNDAPLVAQLHLAQLAFAQVMGDIAAARTHAEWLVQRRPGTDLEKVGLGALAQLADDAAENAKPADRPARAAEAFEAFRRLAEFLGDGPERLRSDRNALVASSRLAQHALDAGHPEIAARQLDKILRVYPNDANYLRRAGLAHAAAGQHERALACWRPLVAGLPTGTDAWFEARYHQIQSLAHLDPPAAHRALEQLKLLHPDLGRERWREKFLELETARK